MNGKLLIIFCFLIALSETRGTRRPRGRHSRRTTSSPSTTTATTIENSAEPSTAAATTEKPTETSTDENTKAGDFTIVHTGQLTCYRNYKSVTTCPSVGQAFYGQDGNYPGDHQPSYTDNGDGTITDVNTGLMWQQDPGDMVSLQTCIDDASTLTLGGHSDWRAPTVKELYSLIKFNGKQGTTADDSIAYIDDDIFKFTFGPGGTAVGERLVDCQAASTTIYVSTTMNGDATLFGVNFADGRIKGYPISNKKSRTDNVFYCYHVRDNTAYGTNDFVDNGDGTVTDQATGLMWAQVDSGHLEAGTDGDGKLNWKDALEWAEGLDYAGHTDWRLPNAKELQGIVDYSRSPDTTSSAAIDPIFEVTEITNEGGETDYPWYWTGTTHREGRVDGQGAVYVTFGRALGYWNSGGTTLYDVHGAGAQRSDFKAGDPADYPAGHGPQGDVIRIYNFVRPVRNA